MISTTFLKGQFTYNFCHHLKTINNFMLTIDQSYQSYLEYEWSCLYLQI